MDERYIDDSQKLQRAGTIEGGEYGERQEKRGGVKGEVSAEIYEDTINLRVFWHSVTSIPVAVPSMLQLIWQRVLRLRLGICISSSKNKMVMKVIKIEER